MPPKPLIFSLRCILSLKFDFRCKVSNYRHISQCHLMSLLHVVTDYDFKSGEAVFLAYNVAGLASVTADELVKVEFAAQLELDA